MKSRGSEGAHGISAYIHPARRQAYPQCSIALNSLSTIVHPSVDMPGLYGSCTRRQPALLASDTPAGYTGASRM